MSVLHLWHAAAHGFEAACSVASLPPGHRARRLHGHSFLARIRAELPHDWATFPGAEVEQVQAALAAAVAPLDHQHLNAVLADDPTDENLARWLRARLATRVPGLRQVGVLSTTDCGVDLDPDDQAHVWRRYRFQSAHQLPNVPAGHKCGRMHGHGFEVIVHARQPLAPEAGVSIDYDHLDALWAPLHAELDHACLNDLPGLDNPTSEMLAAWLWARLQPVLPQLSWLTVYETASCGAQYDGRQFRIWKDFTLDSAVVLQRAPAGDHRRRLHGHTWTLRLHLCAPLDAVRGWTVDFGDVKAQFNPLFKRLDHHPLHELPGLVDGDAASLAHWIRAQAAPLLPALERVDLYQTRGCGVLLAWGGDSPALPV